MRTYLFPLYTLLLVALALPALAVDGVIEINHTCAVQTGCFSGDTAGYPVTIYSKTGGSYRLTSDLIVPDENTDGISVSSPRVTIDLNGFEIVRSGCEGATTDCTPSSGYGAGVERTLFSIHGISVKNGSITGMGFYGVLLGDQAEVSGLRVRWNRIHGIFTGAGSTVSGNIAYQNGFDGIAIGAGSTVSGNTAYANGDDGIAVGPGSIVSGNTANENGENGIAAELASTVSGNTAYRNGRHGIFARAGATISGNTVYNNRDDGIFTGSGSTVSGNTVRHNLGYGLNLNADAAYRENVITSNTAGTVLGGVNLGANACNGTTSCP